MHTLTLLFVGALECRREVAVDHENLVDSKRFLYAEGRHESPLLLLIYRFPPTPSWHLLGKAENTNLSCSVWFFSLYLHFSSAGDSIVSLFSGFASRPHSEPSKALQFPSCAQGSKQQPATSRGSFSFAWQTLGKKPFQTVYTPPTFGKWESFSGPRVRNLSNKN